MFNVGLIVEWPFFSWVHLLLLLVVMYLINYLHYYMFLLFFLRVINAGKSMLNEDQACCERLFVKKISGKQRHSVMLEENGVRTGLPATLVVLRVGTSRTARLRITYRAMHPLFV